MTKIVLTAAERVAAETVGVCMRAVDALEAEVIKGVLVYGIPKDMSPERALKMCIDIEALVTRDYPEMVDGFQCEF